MKNGGQVSNETEQAVRGFVRAAVPELGRLLEGSSLEPEGVFVQQWERGSDGDFRVRPRRPRKSWPFAIHDQLPTWPNYDAAVRHLKSDPVVGSHLDCLVGTDRGSQRLETDQILISLLYAMVGEDDTVDFVDERFDSEWREWTNFFTADQMLFTTVAPLPRLNAASFPVRLNDELVLDRLTDKEVTRCCQVGILQPEFPSFPIIMAGTAVGLRRSVLVDKRVGEQKTTPQASEGTFGHRSSFRDDLVVDDVLSALRLFKSTRIRASGHASWTECTVMETGTAYRVMRSSPYHGKFELEDDEVPQLVELWHELEEGRAGLDFSVHRFNLSFERGRLDDRIVDLIIAAESLFLSDTPQDRGELRFRFALRAAKFIEHASYNERELFRVMRRAYDARSAIVHGGTPEDTRLPDNESASLTVFTDFVEELMRLGLRKALSMPNCGADLGKAVYWEGLVLADPTDSNDV